ncbi:MAG: hypothetical protein M1531_02290 [Chloroflexi bacterium]|nr:hypothetical protein [Chloroflexota bacterium]
MISVLGCRSGRIEFWLSVAFDEDFLQDGFIADPLRMGRAIDNAFRRRNLPARYVVCAVPGYDSCFRQFGIPRIAGHLDAVVPREARRLMGPSLDTRHLVWQSVGVEGGQERIFALAVPRRPLEVLAQTLQYAGIPPSVVDLKPLALARAADRANALVLNAECNSIDVVLVRDGVPAAIRSHYLGEAATEHVLDRLLQEAGNALDEARATAPLSPDTEIYLTGDLASQEGLAYLVESSLGKPPVPLGPPLQIPKEFPLAPFAVNVGLAMREM